MLVTNLVTKRVGENLSTLMTIMICEMNYCFYLVLKRSKIRFECEIFFIFDSILIFWTSLVGERSSLDFWLLPQC